MRCSARSGERLGGGDPCFGSASLYGTADAGVLATETPLSIRIRRYLAAHPAGHGFNPIAELGRSRRIRELPFVHVFGRSQFTVSYFGANIYPENDADHDRYLAVAVELAPGVVGTEEMRRGIAQSIAGQLRRLNSEFAHYTPPERQLPQVSLYPAGDPQYFPPGVKHRYSR